MITSKELANVNEKMKKVDLKGKLYAEVNERIKGFRALCPGGRIETDILRFDGNVAVIKATVSDENGKVLATGTAREDRNSKGSVVNKNAYLENGETSSVGRALGNLGLGLAFGVVVPSTGNLAEDIENANKGIRPIEVRKKKYCETSQRIVAFRKVYPNGSITTENFMLDDTIACFCATVRNENGDVLGQGKAFEEISNEGINKDNYVENAETSAVGRALGMAGFGIDGDVCSADELESKYMNAPISGEDLQLLINKIKEADVPTEKICEACQIKELGEMTIASFEKMMRRLEKTIDKKREEANAPAPEATVNSKLSAAADAYKGKKK